MLAKSGFLAPELSAALARMVGFRNVAVHAYQELQIPVVRSIIREQMDDLLEFSAAALRDS